MTMMTEQLDIFDVISKAALRVFQAGIEINHDTMEQCLLETLTFSRLSGDGRKEKALNAALTQLRSNKGNT